MVAQNYSDEEPTSIPTKAPTVQRFSKRTVISIITSLPYLRTNTHEITQEYIQSHTELERSVYIRAPSQHGLPPGYILKVVKPLYGIPESGLHWYLTYLTNHLETLKKESARADPCVFIKRDGDQLVGLILLQVDESLGFGREKFLNQEEIASSKIRCKPRKPFT